MQTLKKDDARPHLKIDPGKVKVGDIMAMVQFVKVARVDPHGLRFGEPFTIGVKKLEESGTDFDVRGQELVATLLSADQFAEEFQVTKTKAAEILITCYNQPFTVCWVKENGEERVLRGKLVQPETVLGRSMCEDMDLPTNEKGSRLRLVDHRTIKYLIVGGAKYTVK